MWKLLKEDADLLVLGVALLVLSYGILYWFLGTETAYWLGGELNAALDFILGS